MYLQASSLNNYNALFNFAEFRERESALAKKILYYLLLLVNGNIMQFKLLNEN